LIIYSHIHLFFIAQANPLIRILGFSVHIAHHPESFPAFS